MKDIVILGIGGCGREVLWLLEDNNEVLPPEEKWNILGFVEPHPEERQQVSGYPVMSDAWLLQQTGLAVACGLGEARIRERVVTKLKRQNPTLQFPNLISRRAQYSRRIQMGEGCIICAGCVLTCDIILVIFVTVITCTVIAHGCRIVDFVQINPSSNLSGGVQIGHGAQLGTGVKIIPKITIGARAVVGAGAVVIRDLPSDCTAVGCPARVIKQVGKD